jgi:hypothetical protein
MNDYEIAGDLGQFILEKIDSVAQLEALLLCRTNSLEGWTVSVVARRLYIDEQQAEEALAHLNAEKLLELKAHEPVQYCYSPESPSLRLMVDRLVETYAKHLLPVTNLIHSKPKTRIKQFADAFRLRREQE